MWHNEKWWHQMYLYLINCSLDEGADMKVHVWLPFWKVFQLIILIRFHEDFNWYLFIDVVGWLWKLCTWKMSNVLENYKHGYTYLMSVIALMITLFTLMSVIASFIPLFWPASYYNCSNRYEYMIYFQKKRHVYGRVNERWASKHFVRLHKEKKCHL